MTVPELSDIRRKTSYCTVPGGRIPAGRILQLPLSTNHRPNSVAKLLWGRTLSRMLSCGPIGNRPRLRSSHLQSARFEDGCAGDRLPVEEKNLRQQSGHDECDVVGRRGALG